MTAMAARLQVTDVAAAIEVAVARRPSVAKIVVDTNNFWLSNVPTKNGARGRRTDCMWHGSERDIESKVWPQEASSRRHVSWTNQPVNPTTHVSAISKGGKVEQKSSSNRHESSSI